MLQQQTHVKPPSKFTRDGFLKRPYRWQAQLEALQKHLLAAKHKEKLPPKPLRYLERIEKPLPRPPTPTVADYNVSTANLYLSSALSTFFVRATILATTFEQNFL
ncbi:unnamed protein product [Dibothriocephalus latus]|uniref:Uncharacterized protein n=1 Tax=Dibothriocephalus latus TaxID=60516 RepID=A0A3P7LMT4_DIBLA|nr:unnamed protein product [Dibothriocephalus latus]